jgi:hypothetical protein
MDQELAHFFAARVLARRCNELAAEMTRDRPDRSGGFACLPPDVTHGGLGHHGEGR